MIREKMSRPNSSVPKKYVRDGPDSLASASIAYGSCGEIQLAPMEATTINSTMTPPITASFDFKNLDSSNRFLRGQCCVKRSTARCTSGYL
jgi:hypothetical protein